MGQTETAHLFCGLSFLSRLFPPFTPRRMERKRGGGEGGLKGRHSKAVIQPANPAPLRQFLEFTVTKGEPAVHLAASQIPLF